MSVQKEISVVHPDGKVEEVKVNETEGAELIKKMGFLDEDKYSIHMKPKEVGEQLLGDVLTAEALENLKMEDGDQLVIFPRVIGG